jgi:hypothetical protein
MLGHDMRSAFADHLAVLFLVECPINEDARNHTKKHTNTDGDESEPSLGYSEVVRCSLEDVWDCSEEEEKHTECEGGVD